MLNGNDIDTFPVKNKPYKLSDGGNLHLHVFPNGRKYWRFRYRWAGKQNNVSCGVYPETSLEQARERRDVFKSVLVDGIDPSQYAKSERGKLQAEQDRQIAATCFVLDNDGALSFHLGRRCLSLTPSETAELRAFLNATKDVQPKR
jgi:hypothetical protein